MPSIKKLTPGLLRRLVLEEKKKALTHADDAQEIKASDYATTLINHINYIKALKIKEEKLRETADKISMVRRRIKTKIIGDL